LFLAPAAAHAFMSDVACASVRVPPGGMFPPYQLRHEPDVVRSELVPLIYRWLESHEYDDDAELI
jgi:hypothetical protein